MGFGVASLALFKGEGWGLLRVVVSALRVCRYRSQIVGVTKGLDGACGGVYTSWACIGSACGSLEESGVDGLGFRRSLLRFGVLNLQSWVEDGLCLGAMAVARQSTGLGRY